jgi:hypothetical protein
MPVTTASGNVAGGVGVGEAVGVGDGEAVGESDALDDALGEGLTLVHPARRATTETNMTARRLAR